jgi:hypothetical protein
VLAVFFASSLLWPAHDTSDSHVSGPSILASDSPYLHALMALPAPQSTDAYADIAGRLSAAGLDDERRGLDAWMERHVWRHLLGQADDLPATVADVIATGRNATVTLNGLRAQVLDAALRLDIDTTADGSTAPAPRNGRNASEPLRPVDGAPGLWSLAQAPWGYQLWLALRVANATATPLGAFRLVVAWNGDADRRMVCEHRDPQGALIPHGSSVVVWCRDLGGDGRQQITTDPLRWRSDGRSPDSVTVVARDSTLDLPELEVRIPGFDHNAFFLRNMRPAYIQAEGALRGLDCRQLGNCLRLPFKPRFMNAAVLVWTVLMVVLLVAAFSHRRFRLPVLLLGWYSIWNAMGRAMLAWRGDAHLSTSVTGAVAWLLAGGALALLAMLLAAPRNAYTPTAARTGVDTGPRVRSGETIPRVGTATLVIRVIVTLVVIGAILAAAALAVIFYGLSHWQG